MSVSVQSNVDRVLLDIQRDVKSLLSPSQIDKMTREIAVSLAAQMRERIHEEGEDSNNSQIGTYTPEYMKVRTGNYGNSAKFTRGKKQGQIKNSGVFVRGAKKGQQRPKYNRGTSTKVIISLTRQMENDFTLGAKNTKPTKINGGYGIGWKNPTNALIAQGLEQRYKKKIWRTTEQERKQAIAIAEAFVDQQVGKI